MIFVQIPLNIGKFFRNEMKNGNCIKKLSHLVDNIEKIYTFKNTTIILDKLELRALIGNPNVDILEQLKKKTNTIPSYTNACSYFLLGLKRQTEEIEEIKEKKRKTEGKLKYSFLEGIH